MIYSLAFGSAAEQNNTIIGGGGLVIFTVPLPLKAITDPLLGLIGPPPRRLFYQFRHNLLRWNSYK